MQCNEEAVHVKSSFFASFMARIPRGHVTTVSCRPLSHRISHVRRIFGTVLVLIPSLVFLKPTICTRILAGHTNS